MNKTITFILSTNEQTGNSLNHFSFYWLQDRKPLHNNIYSFYWLRYKKALYHYILSFNSKTDKKLLNKITFILSTTGNSWNDLSIIRRKIGIVLIIFIFFILERHKLHWIKLKQNYEEFFQGLQRISNGWQTDSKRIH